MKYAEIDNNGLPDPLDAEKTPIADNSFKAGLEALQKSMDKIDQIEKGEYEPEEPEKTEKKEKKKELNNVPAQESQDEAKTETETETDNEIDIDLSLDPESEPEPEEKPKEKPWQEKKRYFKAKEKKRTFQLQAEKEELKNAADALHAENERLKKELEDSVYSSTVQYGKNAYAELKKAKEDRKRALEEGDTEAILESDISLSNAMQDVRELEAWAARRDREMEEERYNQPQYNQPQYNQPQYNQQQPQYNQPQYNQLQPQYNQPQYNQPQLESDPNTQILHEWVIEHPEVNPKSKRYNAKIAEEMTKFSAKLDEKLHKDNNTEAFFTPKYFNAIDRHFDKVSDKFLGRKGSNPAAPYVGGVRGGRSNAVAAKRSQEVKLNDLEISMAESMNISPEDWKKSKIELAKRDKTR